ncbi:RNA-binding protein pop5 [Coemansia sp. RSA 1822]|nr:RNA-binding protein pop5 [Coemansia sp. RSA 638]KAJ2538658.1 RNA-binding protein pop5 [Coemansia sp. RSA 1853]KAJ2558349.1 RNA-binding protein pop5 [Coemansia sp. RSA 1822]
MVRFKNRYVCFEIMLEPSHASDTAQPLVMTNQDILRLVRENVKLNFGDSGAGLILAGMQVKHFNPHTRLGIIKVPRDHIKMVTATLALITRAKKTPCALRVRHTSGTIKKCQKSAIRTDRELILAYHKDANVAQLLRDSESQISALEI